MGTDDEIIADAIVSPPEIGVRTILVSRNRLTAQQIERIRQDWELLMSSPNAKQIVIECPDLAVYQLVDGRWQPLHPPANPESNDAEANP